MPTTTHTDAELFRRGAATLVASWEACARGSAGAFVSLDHRLREAAGREGFRVLPTAA